MKRTLIVWSLMLMVDLCLGQSSDKYAALYIQDLYNKSVALQPLSAKQADYSDLQPIGEAIGEAKIILLGESSHGDGGAIQVKSRLVQYLCEKKGFEVLLFEYDFFPLMFGKDSLSKNVYLDSFISKNLWPFWYASSSTADLWKYIKRRNTTTRPISIDGVDIQHSGEMTRQKLAPDLHAILTRLHYDTNSKAYKTYLSDLNFAVNLSSLADKKVDSLENLSIQSRIKTITVTVDSLLQENSRIASFVLLALKDTIQQKRWLLELKNIEYFFRLFQGKLNRDKGMASMATALIKNYYAGKKIIVWAHNNHNCLDVNTYASVDNRFARTWYNNGTYNYATFLGADLYREFGEQVYSLAITSYEGMYSPDFWQAKNFKNTAPVKKSSGSSLENYFFAKSNRSPMFIPLPQKCQGHPSGYPWFSAKLFDINTEIKMDYTAAYNGIIVIPETVALKNQ